MTSMQLLLVMKHFRPDEIKRFAGFFIRKAFKNIIVDLPKSLFSSHLQQEWSKRPTILLSSSLDNSLFEALELKAAR